MSRTCSGRDAPTIADVTSAAQHPRERELGHRDAEPLAIGRALHAGEHVVGSKRPIAQPISALAMREPSGGRSPGRYLPVSTPCASGDHTTCPMPFAAQSGNTSSSGSRKSSEYCGCDETNFTTPSGTRSSAAWICAGVQFEKPT